MLEAHPTITAIATRRCACVAPPVATLQRLFVSALLATAIA